MHITKITSKSFFNHQTYFKNYFPAKSKHRGNVNDRTQLLRTRASLSLHFQEKKIIHRFVELLINPHKAPSLLLRPFEMMILTSEMFNPASIVISYAVEGNCWCLYLYSTRWY